MQRTAGLGSALIVVGGGLVAASALGGSVVVSVVLIVPVFSSSSWEFGLGVLLLVLGLATFVGGSLTGRIRAECRTEPEDARTASGGFVLIGPVPIFFGSFARLPPWVRWTVALLGAAALLGVALLYVLLR